jgi:hypothetical protein
MGTNIDNNTMDKSKLRLLVKKAINEVLNEAPIIYGRDGSSRTKAKTNLRKTNAYRSLSSQERTNAERAIDTDPDGGVIDVQEMANVAITYELVPNINPEDYSGKKRRIIDTMLDAGGPMSKPAVAAALGYDKQNPINADFMTLVAQGAITPTTEQAAPRFSRPAEEPEEEIELDDTEVGQEEFEDEIEDEIENEEEVEDDYRKANTEFDVPEVEPEVGELEPAETTTLGMSEEDYQAWIKYDDLKQRLSATKSNISKAKRSRRGGDDLSDYSMDNEIERLTKLKKSLQGRISDLVSTSSYLQDKIAQETKPTPVSVEDIIDDEDQQLDEWIVNKWKYYAGIKK